MRLFGRAERGRSADLSIDRLYSFFVGGETIEVDGWPRRARVGRPAAAPMDIDPNGFFRVGQTYVSAVELRSPKSPYPVALLHGGGFSGAAFETENAGSEPWLMRFLHAGFNTLSCDRAGAGRAGWARYPEIYVEEANFFSAKTVWELFRIGRPGSYELPGEASAYPGSCFPTDQFDALLDHVLPPFRSEQERGTVGYGALYRRCGPLIVVSHSAAGPAAISAMAANPGTVVAQVLLEPSGAPELDEAQLEAAAAVPHLIVWGDFIHDGREGWEALRQSSRTYADTLTAAGANMTWLDLPAAGIRGNSHMLMFDGNNGELVTIIIEWLQQTVLTGQ